MPPAPARRAAPRPLSSSTCSSTAATAPRISPESSGCWTESEGPMITLYDLVFQEDRGRSPFCWRARFALKHKGLDWRDEPVGFTEKQKIAFAQSQTVPVIHDGPNVVKDSWAIAGHLDQAYPDKPLFKDATTLAYARFASGWVDTAVHVALVPGLVGGLDRRGRAAGQP